MKRLLLFWREVLEELGTWCGVCTTHDFNTVERRFEHEGDEFLTITLPTLAKDLERSLAQGWVTHDLFSSFKRRQNLPVLLGGFFEIVFDRESGRLHDVSEENLPSIVNAIFAIRQLSLMFGKIEKQCTPERDEAAIDSYIRVEEELRQWELEVTDENLSDFRKISFALFGDVLAKLDHEVRELTQDIIPAHGPGRTADRLSGNQKYRQIEWPERLDAVFPYGECCIPNWRYYYLLDRVEYLGPGAERPSRIVLVPKTQKTPRVIAIEPTCMQYMQQGISRRLVALLETVDTVRGMIGFEHQEPNQLMAQRGSLYGDLATLDLSEASDRVSWRLVKEGLCGWYPFFGEGIGACRSTRADVPDRGVIDLVKFASMGSALTFPIEAMVFLTCIFHGIGKALNRRVTRALIQEYRDRVRVYGDDIIVPVDFATSVIASLELFGFKVNADKSFWTGGFRESCGREFFAGEDVSITRVRRDFPESRSDVPEVVSTVSLRNQLYQAGLWKTASYLDQLIGEVLPHYPTVNPDSPALGRHTCTNFYEVRAIRGKLQSPVVRAYVVKSSIPKSFVWDEDALLKCLLKQGEEPFVDVMHLERQGRPENVYLKLRWVSPF